MADVITFNTGWLGYGAALCSAVLACLSVILPGRSLTRLAFALGMGLLGLEALLATLSSEAMTLAQAARWQGLRMVVLALMPASWLLFSLVFARGNRLEFLSRWWPGLTAALLLPLLTLFVLPGQLTDGVAVSQTGFQFRLGGRGMLLHAMLLIGYVLVLVNLERTFRAAVGVMRWRIKFIIIGLALLFLVRIYTCSQKLLYHGWSSSLDILQALALLAGSVLIIWSVLRCGLGEANVYPSRRVILGSVTLTIVGVYLLLVALLTKAVGALGGTESLPLQAMLILAGLAGLGLLAVSDHARQRLEMMLSRHFRRPSFDYRSVWQRFTERCASEIEEGSFCGETASFVSELFQSLSVTIWLVEENSGRVRFGASTVLTEGQASELLAQADLSSSVWRSLGQRGGLISIDTAKGVELQEWQQLCPTQFPAKGGQRYLLSLRVRDKLMGVLALADRVGGRKYTAEERDLLHVLAFEVAAVLLNMHLLQRRSDARETEALRTMSAFFAHDLKNTGSTLSLTLQNLRKHFGNPDFREDALRAVSMSVDHINRVVEGLNTLQRELKLDVRKEDVNALVRQVMQEMGTAMVVKPELDLQTVPAVVLDAKQIKKVLVNLLLNARDAVSDAGRISVRTGSRDQWAYLSVRDNGCGMTADFVRKSLFRPFQTTKKEGLGIGMFQSRMIVEAHGGRIEVESQTGVGTAFHVLLPQT